MYCLLNLTTREPSGSFFLSSITYWALFRSIFRWFRGRKVLQTDKEYYYFKCPTCGQSMRLPRGLGKVEITCRSCASRFETKS